MDKNNFGLSGDQVPRDSDWIAGVESGIPFENNIPAADWSLYLPDADLQVLNDGKTKWETNACTAFAAANEIKKQLNWLLAAGKLNQEEINYYTEKGYIVNGKWSISARYVALVAKNDPARGNTFVNVADAVRLHADGSGFGLVPDAMCPKGNSAAEFYTPLSQEVIDFGKNFFKYLQINYEFIYSGQCNVDLAVIKKQLQQAPLMIASPVLAGWFGDEVVSSQPLCISQHATDIFKVDNVIHDFDSETTTPRKLALDYPITSVMKIVVRKLHSPTPPPVQIHQFNIDMTIGDRGPEIVLLQNKLKHLGFFPLDVESTGNYGNITKTAVAKFQKSQGINPLKPGQFCYIVTRTALNKISIN